jgi:hypothetical protein
MQTTRKTFEDHLTAASWGMLLSWGGISLAAGVTWATGLLGVAAIVLGAQYARTAVSLPVQNLSLFAGALFAASSIWHLLVGVSLGPWVLGVLGTVLLFGTLLDNSYGRGHWSYSSEETSSCPSGKGASHPRLGL